MTNTTTNKPHLARTGLVASLMAAGALMAGAPAHAAGKAERARQAIATAQAKIQTADALGTAEVQPRESAQAKAALAHAQENLAAGHKPEAIDDAIHASALADTAIGTMQKRQARAADEQAATQQAALDDSRQQPRRYGYRRRTVLGCGSGRRATGCRNGHGHPGHRRNDRDHPWHDPRARPQGRRAQGRPPSGAHGLGKRHGDNDHAHHPLNASGRFRAHEKSPAGWTGGAFFVCSQP